MSPAELTSGVAASGLLVSLALSLIILALPAIGLRLLPLTNTKTG